jgi:hypothetical protein
MLSHRDASLPPGPAKGSDVPRINIGVFGVMNAGKSTLMNAITRQETSIVDATPGTTAGATHVAHFCGGEMFRRASPPLCMCVQLEEVSWPALACVVGAAVATSCAVDDGPSAPQPGECASRSTGGYSVLHCHQTAAKVVLCEVLQEACIA